MAPLHCAAKFDPFLALDCAIHALHPSAIQGKEGIKLCHLATSPSLAASLPGVQLFGHEKGGVSLRRDARMDEGIISASTAPSVEQSLYEAWP